MSKSEETRHDAEPPTGAVGNSVLVDHDTPLSGLDDGSSSHGPNTKDVELQNLAGLEKERHPSSSSSAGSARSKGKADSEQSVEYYCGVGRCRPSWMQRLRDARFFTFLLCCNTFIEGALVSGRHFQHFGPLCNTGNLVTSSKLGIEK